MPPKIIHKTFIKKFKHPCPGGLLFTFAPNGNKANDANLIDCSPNGIPIIVTIKATLEIMYSMQIIKPPKIIHRIFSNILILIFNKFKQIY